MFPAALPAAAARLPVWLHHDVPHLAGESAIAVKYLAVKDQSPTDARAQGQKHHVGMSLPRTQAMLPQRMLIGIVVHHHRQPHHACDFIAYGHIAPLGQVGRPINDAAFIIDDARDSASHHRWRPGRFCSHLPYHPIHYGQNCRRRLVLYHRLPLPKQDGSQPIHQSYTDVGPTQVHPDSILRYAHNLFLVFRNPQSVNRKP